MVESRSEKNLEIAEEIENEERIKRNKKIIKTFLWIFIPIVLVVSTSYFLLRYVGNFGVIVREYPIYSKNVSVDLKGFKIIHFGDIHYNENTSIDKIKDMVSLINKANPDIVIFTGDLIDQSYNISLTESEELINILKNINSNISKYAIKGDEDKENFNNIFDNSDFTILSSGLEKIYIGNSSINLITYSSSDNSFTLDDNSSFSIVLTHEPDNTDNIINKYSPNMVLAGHSHNGQVVLPLIGGIMKKDGAKKYSSPYYKLKNTEVFITGGIGNSDYEYRLFNHPSINFYRLRTSD